MATLSRPPAPSGQRDVLRGHTYTRLAAPGGTTRARAFVRQGAGQEDQWGGMGQSELSPDKFYLTVVHYRLNEDFTHHRLNEDFTHPFKTDKNGDGFESQVFCSLCCAGPLQQVGADGCSCGS